MIERYFQPARLKKEGSAIHPDDLDSAISDKKYANQLQSYKDTSGDSLWDQGIVRPWLLSEIV